MKVHWRSKNVGDARTIGYLSIKGQRQVWCGASLGISLPDKPCVWQMARQKWGTCAQRQKRKSDLLELQVFTRHLMELLGAETKRAASAANCQAMSAALLLTLK